MSESSSSSGKCPQCGAALPAGAAGRLCPVCLMAEAMVPTGHDGEAIPTHPALSPEELAPHFPQLEILECLGRGGMGVVYKARQKSLNRLVALKLLAPERVGDADFAERFQKEAQALAALSHPHIVTVHDFGQAGGFYFLLMEFVDGVNLRQAMKAGRFTPEQALAIVPPVCEALQYAHEHGVVHRDIKPENLLLDKDGRVKIADFGIARMLGAPQPSAAASIGVSGFGEPRSQVVGTPQYMAPEQKEHRATDHRADIYSLGVVLYELLTGELPADKLQPPSRKVTIDVRLDEIVLRALEQEPERRYQTAGDFRTQVETFTQSVASPAGTPPRASQERAPVPVLRWADRWMWDTSNLVLMILVPGILSLLMVAGLHPALGARAYWALLLPLGGGLGAAIFGWVGSRVRRLKVEFAAPGAEVVEALIFKRPFQSPGIAALYADRLELRRVMGAPLLISLDEIVSLAEVKWFNGSRLVGKRGFELNLKNGQRIGVAVPGAFGERWLARLSSSRIADQPGVTTPSTAASEEIAALEADDRTDWRFPLLVFTLIYALFLVYVQKSLPGLPEKIAVHFDGVGRPNGWQARSSYAWFMCLEPLAEVAFFLLISCCVAWLPIQVSVPRRDYWLTKDRRPELAALMLRWFLWLGCGLVFFDAALHATLLEANRATPPLLSMEGEHFQMIAFLVALMIWIVMFIMRMAEAGHQKPARRSRFWNWATIDRSGRRRPSWHIFLLRVVIATVVALLLRQFVIRSYAIAGSSVEPELPTGSHVAVWLLGHSYHAGDIIAYDQNGKAFVARVVRSDGTTVTVNRNGSPDEAIPLSRVAGRVVSVYWRATSPSAKTRVKPGPGVPNSDHP